jgi:hypothetical protein
MYLLFNVEMCTPAIGAIRFACVTLESHGIVENSDTPIKGRDHQIWRAEAMAADHGFDHWLDDTESYIVPKNVQSSEGHETFVHSNMRQYLNDILLTEDQQRQQIATVRVMLDCLFGKVGYISYYRRKLKDLTVDGIRLL